MIPVSLHTDDGLGRRAILNNNFPVCSRNPNTSAKQQLFIVSLTTKDVSVIGARRPSFTKKLFATIGMISIKNYSITAYIGHYKTGKKRVTLNYILNAPSLDDFCCSNQRYDMAFLLYYW
jgi:hypothetical protein